MTKKKFYAVKKGHKIGIFDSWAKCKKEIDGYSGAEYKGFVALSEAQDYLNSSETTISNSKSGRAQLAPTISSQLSTLNSQNSDEVLAYVDGSYNIKSKVYGYGVVLLLPTGEIEKLFGSGENDNAVSMRNVAGELKGAIVAMQYAVNNHYKKLTIYHDYEGVSKWAKKEWKANLEATKAYQDFCQKIKKTVELKFVKVLAHSGVEYNELADELAKEGAGILV
jgi:ribonuclease HI